MTTVNTNNLSWEGTNLIL